MVLLVVEVVDGAVVAGVVPAGGQKVMVLGTAVDVGVGQLLLVGRRSTDTAMLLLLLVVVVVRDRVGVVITLLLLLRRRALIAKHSLRSIVPLGAVDALSAESSAPVLSGND
jgi:hypothetical protein